MVQLGRSGTPVDKDAEEMKEPIEAEVLEIEMAELGEAGLSQEDTEDLPVAQNQQHAVPLTPRREEDLPFAQVTVQAQVVEKIRARPKQYCAGCGCLVVLIVFLLAFLLIPRAPSLRLTKISFPSPDESEDPIILTIRLGSRSLVQTEWRNLDVDLEFITENTGPFDVGTFGIDNTFTTSAFGSKNTQPEIDSIQDSNLNDLRRHCAATGDATLRLRGHIRAGTSRFRVESDWDTINCS